MPTITFNPTFPKINAIKILREALTNIQLHIGNTTADGKTVFTASSSNNTLLWCKDFVEACMELGKAEAPQPTIAVREALWEVLTKMRQGTKSQTSTYENIIDMFFPELNPWTPPPAPPTPPTKADRIHVAFKDFSQDGIPPTYVEFEKVIQDIMSQPDLA